MVFLGEVRGEHDERGEVKLQELSEQLVGSTDQLARADEQRMHP